MYVQFLLGSKIFKYRNCGTTTNYTKLDLTINKRISLLFHYYFYISNKWYIRILSTAHPILFFRLLIHVRVVLSISVFIFYPLRVLDMLAATVYGTVISKALKKPYKVLHKTITQHPTIYG